MTTVRVIIERYLRENGYDGLFGLDCGCEKEDLAPCCNYCLECEPGVYANHGPHDEGKPHECDGGEDCKCITRKDEGAAPSSAGQKREGTDAGI